MEQFIIDVYAGAVSGKKGDAGMLPHSCYIQSHSDEQLCIIIEGGYQVEQCISHGSCLVTKGLMWEETRLCCRLISVVLRRV